MRRRRDPRDRHPRRVGCRHGRRPAPRPAGVGAKSSGSDTLPKKGEWDARIVEFVQFVEKERGLKFEHPIPVDFLSDKKFLKVLNGDDHKPTKAERTAAEHYAGQMRALGLVEGDVDLIGANEDLDAASVTGFYSDRPSAWSSAAPTSTTSSPASPSCTSSPTRSRTSASTSTSSTTGVHDSGEDFALTALIEGDARFVEEAYYFSLTDEEQDEYDNWDPGRQRRARRARRDERRRHPARPRRDPVGAVHLRPAVHRVPRQHRPCIRWIVRSRNRPLSEENIIDPVCYQLKEDPIKVPVPRSVRSEKEEVDGRRRRLRRVLAVHRAREPHRPEARARRERRLGWRPLPGVPRPHDKECVRIDDRRRHAEPTARRSVPRSTRGSGTMPSGAASVAARRQPHTKSTACESTATAPTIERLGDAMDAAHPAQRAPHRGRAAHQAEARALRRRQGGHRPRARDRCSRSRSSPKPRSWWSPPRSGRSCPHAAPDEADGLPDDVDEPRSCRNPFTGGYSTRRASAGRISATERAGPAASAFAISSATGTTSMTARAPSGGTYRIG